MSEFTGKGQRGSTALSAIAAFGVLLVFITLLTQFVVWGYARAVVRAGALEGARAAAPLEAADGACERRFESVRDGLLAGRLGTQVSDAECVIGEDFVTVRVEARLQRWLPISPDWEFTIEVVAVRERTPA